MLHDPPINVPFVDSTFLVARPWIEWLIINKRDKANRVEDSTEGHLLTADSNGHPQDSGTASASVLVDIEALEAADVLIEADIIDLEAASLSNEVLSFYFASL